ncbi:MAG: hypothetical protein AAF767_00050 [Pseudomonadota bacterium]
MRSLILCLSFIFAVAGPAHAEKWAVKAIKYKNNGAYYAYFDIYSLYNGAKIQCQGKNTKGKGIKSGKSVTIQLDNSDGSLIDSDEYGDTCFPEPSNEVWGMVYIDRGSGYTGVANKESCRKDGAKFYYHPHGGTLVVQTKGTTENNNRCTIVDKGGVRYRGYNPDSPY